MANYRAFLRRAKVATAGAALGCAAVLGGCASSPTLFQALDTTYRGYEELSPKLSPGPRGTAFPFTPGTLLPVVSTTADDGERAWIAATDLRCGPDVDLRTLNHWKRRSYHYHRGLLTGTDARAWLEKRTGQGAIDLTGISSVGIDVTSVRSYEPSRLALRQLNAQASSGCILPVAFDGSVRRVKAVIIGTVRVRLAFEQGVDLVARAHVTDHVTVALGVGFERVSESEIAGRNIAFGVKWQ